MSARNPPRRTCASTVVFALAVSLIAAHAALNRSTSTSINPARTPRSGRACPPARSAPRPASPACGTPTFRRPPPHPRWSTSPALPTAATVQITATSTTPHDAGASTTPRNTGDFALLLNDGSQIGTTTPGRHAHVHVRAACVPGPYSVVTYTARAGQLRGPPAHRHPRLQRRPAHRQRHADGQHVHARRQPRRAHDDAARDELRHQPHRRRRRPGRVCRRVSNHADPRAGGDLDASRVTPTLATTRAVISGRVAVRADVH